jgi:hypothetical protein
MNRTMFRPAALAVLLALSLPSLAIEPFQPLPDLEALPDLDSAPPRKLHENQPSWGQPVDANGNVGGKPAKPRMADDDPRWFDDRYNPLDPSQTPSDPNAPAPGNNNGAAGGHDKGNSPGNQNGSSANNANDNTNGTASSNDNGGYARNNTGGNNNAGGNTNGSGNNSANNGGMNSTGNVGLNSGHGSGLNSDAYPPLTKVDAAMQPNYTPPGMPQMPSKCAEDKACRPCFDDANANLDIRRRNLEKVRGIYTYTHRFAQDGKDLMNGVGGMAGGAPAVEAAVQSRSVDQSLDAFDETVRAKNAELLGKLQDDLHELAACEAKYYGNDEWYARYGELYYQFMQARYAL